MSVKTRSVSKRHMLQGFLADGYSRVWFITNFAGVEFPQDLKQGVASPLYLGSELVEPPTNVAVECDGIHAMVGVGCVFIPWEAVFMMNADRGDPEWSEDAPEEMRELEDEEVDEGAPLPVVVSAPTLRIVVPSSVSDLGPFVPSPPCGRIAVVRELIRLRESR